jgi:rhodanese-related sulfurtransferase
MEAVNLNPYSRLAPAAISPAELQGLLGRPDTPLILDVRKPEPLVASPWRLPLAVSWGPEQLDTLIRTQPPQPVVVYCVYGHAVGKQAAATLSAAGWPARYLLGGIEGGELGVDPPELLASLRASTMPRVRQRPELGMAMGPGSSWVTREGPKIDRIACPWLVRRFIDRDARFFYVPAAEVFAEAKRLGAVAFDLPGAPITHVGDRCSFDTLLDAFGLQLPALDRLALIVRGADTDHLALDPAAAGLLALSLGFSRRHATDDPAMLEAMMPVYDALYAWCGQEVAGVGESHRWSFP